MAAELPHAFLEAIARLLEGAGVLAILGGTLVALYTAVRGILHRNEGQAVFDMFRTQLAKSILIGVEFLIAADIIGTVIVEPSMDSLGVLAVIVLIRTFLSFSLEVEIEGRWPWQRNSNRHEDD
ncbi:MULTISPECIES: DUF1622 domain-containing protein [unclassified Yoonia]|uniref:DUF1622 domain-containing protein n=1 Tax=unclassified Yoonia TaxID=2629118 RepID=UPI002AFEE536|nr:MULTISPECIES: DUF1622 domain-containing protein [unclassified Yoonia]